MSEIELPLFPLPVILFPNTRQVLHIFEPRFRQMLTDCLNGDRRFGLAFADPTRQGGDSPLQPGDVGCRAHLQSHHRFDDGRANILVVGEDRFVFHRFVERDRMYHVGRVEPFDDDPGDPSALARLATKVRKSFVELQQSIRAVSETDPRLAKLAEDPRTLSFQVAAAVDATLQMKEGWLRLTSTRMRLEKLQTAIRTQHADVAKKAQWRKKAKRNGSGNHRPVIVSDQ